VTHCEGYIDEQTGDIILDWQDNRNQTGQWALSKEKEGKWAFGI
jgi:hypothetical protein